MIKFRSRRKKLCCDLELGAQAWFVDARNCNLKISSGTIKEIYYSGSHVCFSVEPGGHNTFNVRDIRENFFKSKNECIEQCISALEKQKD